MAKATKTQQFTEWTPHLVLSTVAMLSSGTLVVMSLKVQGTTYNFKHSLTQTMFMFVGEYLNIVAFALPFMISEKVRLSHFKALTAQARENNQKVNSTKLWAALPCLIDSVSSGLGISSYLLLPASIAQMLLGGQIISTCIFSKIINKRPVLRHHLIGMIVSTLGFAVVGLAGFVATNDEPSSSYTTTNFILGVTFILFNLTMVGIQVNLEELIITRHAIPPQRLVGLEGMFGIIWISSIISVLAYFRCPDYQLCDMHGYVEDLTAAVQQLLSSPGLLFWALMTVISMTAYNALALHVTQVVSSMFRIFWSTMVTVIVWITCLLVGYESLDFWPFTIQFTGFSLLILGNLIYNGMITGFSGQKQENPSLITEK